MCKFLVLAMACSIILRRSPLVGSRGLAGGANCLRACLFPQIFEQKLRSRTFFRPGITALHSVQRTSSFGFTGFATGLHLGSGCWRAHLAAFLHFLKQNRFVCLLFRVFRAFIGAPQRSQVFGMPGASDKKG